MESSDAGSDAATRVVGADRVLAVLLELGRHAEGATLDQLARAVTGSKPTVHRALAALIRAGLAEHDARGHYALGDEFFRIAFTRQELRPDTARVVGRLRRLVEAFGEAAHYAVLDGRSIVYRAKVDPPAGAVRLTSVVGGRNPAHATGVGKALLAATLPDLAAVREWIGDVPLERKTDRTLVDARQLDDEFTRIREQGYAVDDQENEVGINCIAFPVHLTSPTAPSGAISVSAVAYRTPLDTLLADATAIRRIVLDAG